MAVSALPASALRISSARWAGVSFTDSAPGMTLPAAEGARSGAAVAAPDWTAAAIRAETPTRATAAALRRAEWGMVSEVVWEVRLCEELLNTDSFCTAAGLAARGDRSAVGRTGRTGAVRRTSCGCSATAQRWNM
ncbi:hypothetical protein SALBM311S_03993 [Streptomyces alboniger]